MRFAHVLSSSITTVSLLLCTLLLVGCGQKGPLYLPQNDSTAAEPRLKPESETDTVQ